MIQKTDFKKNLAILDVLRGAAAIYVLIGHARWLLWEGFTEGYSTHPENYNLLNKFSVYFFSLFKFGHEAVLLFFVLSGFVIHYSTASQLHRTQAKLSIKTYIYKRVKRIYPPYLFAIVLTLVLGYIGTSMQLPVYYGATPYSLINKLINFKFDVADVLGYLGFLQNVYVNGISTNGPLWSLMYEWWFYMLYIPVLFIFNKHKLATSILIICLWVFNSYFGLGFLLLTTVFNYFLSWFLGMLLADYLLFGSFKKYQAALYLFFVAVFSVLFYDKEYGKDTLIAVLVTLFLYAVLATNAFEFLKKFKTGAPFSYTLYVVHFPILCFMSGIIMKYNEGYLPQNLLYVLLSLVVIIPLSWGIHFITEKPFVTKKK